MSNNPQDTPEAHSSEEKELAKEKDAEEKMKLARTTIASLCSEDSEDSEFSDLLEIGQSLKEGDTLHWICNDYLVST